MGNEEGKESKQDCEGERSEGCSAQGQERKNSWRIDQRKSGEEQEGQGCVQECLGSRPLKKWSEACKKARKTLGITGFCAVGGSSAQGKALYAKVKSILAGK